MGLETRRYRRVRLPASWRGGKLVWRSVHSKHEAKRMLRAGITSLPLVRVRRIMIASLNRTKAKENTHCRQLQSLADVKRNLQQFEAMTI